MDTGKTQQKNKNASAVKPTEDPLDRRVTTITFSGGVRHIKYLIAELSGAVHDHRQWINSSRARTLETTFDISGRVLVFIAYIALSYLAVNSFVGIRDGLARGIYAIPEHVDGMRVALFYILVAGLIGPILILAIGIGIGWMHNLTTAAANRALPRFVRPLIYPSILFVVAAGFSTYHSDITATLARGYVHAKSTIEAASPQETSADKMIEISRLGVPGENLIMEPSSSGEHELARLQSIFKRGQPCPIEGQIAETASPSEPVRPEPGFAPERDCPAKKAAVQN